MTRLSGDQWKFPDGSLIAVEPGMAVKGVVLWNGYDYDNQFWVRHGRPVHHALCGKSTDVHGRPWNGECNACLFLKKGSSYKEEHI